MLKLKIFSGDCTTINFELSRMRFNEHFWAIRGSEDPTSKNSLLIYNKLSNLKNLIRDFDHEIKKSCVTSTNDYYICLEPETLLDAAGKNNQKLLSAILFDIEKIRSL